MAEKLDLRVRMTQKLLTDALTQLMTHTPFENLSVVDICTEAQVHRTTFYKHFEDKHHLLRRLFEGQTQALESRLTPALSPDFHEYSLQLCREMLTNIAQNSAFFIGGVFNAGNEAVQQVYQASVVQWMQQHFEDFSELHSLRFSVPLAVVAEYTAGALISIAIWWLKNNMFVSSTEVVSYLDALAGNHFYAQTR